MHKAFLLINGNPPKALPDLEQYGKIFCTDGAYAHLLANHVRPHMVIGDFDSITEDDISPKVEIVKKIDQDYTDFYKCLEIICQEGFKEVDVYGSTGSEHDHFLGNLTTALQFKHRIQLKFFDDFAVFYFTQQKIYLSTVRHKIISLFPYPTAINVQSKGLFYPLNGMTLDIVGRIGTRNYAVSDEVEITYDQGEMLLFISHKALTAQELSYKDKIN